MCVCVCVCCSDASLSYYPNLDVLLRTNTEAALAIARILPTGEARTMHPCSHKSVDAVEVEDDGAVVLLVW